MERRRPPVPLPPEKVTSHADGVFDEPQPNRSNELVEGLTQLVYATAFSLAIAAVLVGDRSRAPHEKEPAGTTAPAKAGEQTPQAQRADKQLKDGIRPELETRIELLPRILGSRAELLKHAPKLAPAVSPNESNQEKCRAVRRILADHNKDILTIAVYLQGVSESIANRELGGEFQKQIREKLKMTPEDAVKNPEGVRQALEKHMKGTYSYGVIQRCSTLEMLFFGGFLSKSIKENEQKAIPVVNEILEGARSGKPGAVGAAEALGRIMDDFMVSK